MDLAPEKKLPSLRGQIMVVVKAAPDIPVVSLDGCDVPVPTKFRVTSVMYFSHLFSDTHRLLKEQLLMMASQR